MNVFRENVLLLSIFELPKGEAVPFRRQTLNLTATGFEALRGVLADSGSLGEYVA